MYYVWHRGHTQLYWDIKGGDKGQRQRQQKLNDLFVRAFGEIDNGSFVEVGCFDGINAGVITPLADKGWKGLCLDANPGQVDACKRNHKDNKAVEVVHTAVGAFKGEVTLYGGGAGATVNETYRNAAKSISWTGKLNDCGKVPQTTLDELLETHGFTPGFEVLSVDVEGNEPEVFEAFDLEKWRPKMMVVEMTDGHPDFKNKTELNKGYHNLRNKITSSGYEEVYRDIINTVYFRKDD